jgi:hypothetical protein
MTRVSLSNDASVRTATTSGSADSTSPMRGGRFMQAFKVFANQRQSVTPPPET